MELHKKLQVTVTDYQILSQMLISFFKNLAEVSIIFNFEIIISRAQKHCRWADMSQQSVRYVFSSYRNIA
jgi:hypothetical protein